MKLSSAYHLDAETVRLMNSIPDSEGDAKEGEYILPGFKRVVLESASRSAPKEKKAEIEAPKAKDQRLELDALLSSSKKIDANGVKMIDMSLETYVTEGSAPKGGSATAVIASKDRDVGSPRPSEISPKTFAKNIKDLLSTTTQHRVNSIVEFRQLNEQTVALLDESAESYEIKKG